MTKGKIEKFAVSILTILVMTLGLSACIHTSPAPGVSSPGPSSSNTLADLTKIQHFVFIMQENRSFDSYFGTFPGADGIPPGISFVDPHDGTTVTPFHDTRY